jgi:hypothetical protein
MTTFYNQNLSVFPKGESHNSEYYRDKNQNMNTHYMMAPCRRKPVSYICNAESTNFYMAFFKVSYIHYFKTLTKVERKNYISSNKLIN